MLLLLFVLAATAPASASAVDVGADELLAALRQSQGYDLTATANAARMHAEVYLRLARAARERDPDGPPLLIRPESWHEAYLRRTGLTSEQAPPFVRLAFERRQQTELDYRQDRVVRKGGVAGCPLLAVNVRSSWPERKGQPESYSYLDERASPQLRVTVRRVLTYRLLDCGEILYFAEVEGMRGRPVSGLLGALFRLIGEVSVVESRIAIAPDGTLVTRGRGKKGLIDATATATVRPDGTADKGLPADRPDLAVLASRLNAVPRFEFVPFAP